ncbi:MAG: bifunctional oligoribonuclease/PAP phosphatase NrnA [Anaerolineae bacterium]|nr:bifunctional oligoribonuclease/PAP phosphatase NrnA [Anaerolineae bacterium]
MGWADAQALVERAGRIIIITHISPDGDAIGTLLGLGHALRAYGKTVTLAVDEGVPSTLRFLPGSPDVRKHLNGVQADLAIAVDCGDESRMGNVGKSIRTLGLPLINIDHHHSNTHFGDVNIVNAAAVAAADCILDWLEQNLVMLTTITPDVAYCLLCGLVTDTLCFRTSNVTADTLGKAQRLIAYGGNLSDIVQHTVSNVPTEVFRLWGQVMPTVRIEDGVIWVKITQTARKAAGVTDTKDGGLVSLLVQADEAHISCVLTEKDNGQIELSFRSIPGYDVSQVAISLGGGGHVQASGATVNGTLDEIEAQVIPLLKAAAQTGVPT